MAITALNDYSIGDSNLNAIMTSLDKTYKGKAEMSLSEYDTTAAPVIKVGSVFDNNGALYIIDTSDITPTGYAGITVSTTFYLVYDESAGAFVYSEVAPTWSDAFQGWYSGNDRYFFSMYKDSGGTLYQLKAMLLEQSSAQIDNLTIQGVTTHRGLVKFKKYYTAASVTEDAVWAELVTWVPSVGDFLHCSGNASDGSNYGYIVGIYRSDSTFIRVHIIDVSAAVAIDSIDINDVATGTINIEISSNYDHMP